MKNIDSSEHIEQSEVKATVVIVTKNESLNIKDCIHSVRNFHTIVVADSKSDDSTRILALEAMQEINKSVEILNFEWNGRYPKKKQWVLDNFKSTNDWILFMYADDRVPSKLEKEISHFIEFKASNFGAAYMDLEYHFAGEKLKFGYHPRKLNFINKYKCKYAELDDLWVPGYWENEMHVQPAVVGRTYKFKNKLTHNDNDPIITWFERHCRYAKREVLLNIASNHDQDFREKKVGRAKIFQSIPAKPIFIFLYSYFLCFGFLDGIRGKNYAFAYAWYYWLQGVIKKDEMKRNG